MFTRKKKPDFPLRPPYSIREELETLNPFVRRDKIGAMQPYTMEDIQAVERRLNFELPAPIRDLYLVIGDYMCLQDEFYFRALELLRWDGDYLLLAHGVSDNLGFGLKRKDPNATVYEWICNPAITEKELEHDQRSYVHFESDFELYRHKGDSSGAEAAIKGYFDFWKSKRFRSEIIRLSISQNIHASFTYFWDAFILHFVLRRMVDDADQLDQARMTEELDQCYLSSDLPRLPKALEEANKAIVPPFVPLSSHLELIQDSSRSVSPVFAYLNQEDDCLLLMHPEATNHYFLLTQQPVPYSFAQEMEGKTGLLFYSRKGNGKDKVLTRHQEMREQVLFRPS